MTNIDDMSCGCGTVKDAVTRIRELLIKMANDDECSFFQLAVLFAAAEFQKSMITSFLQEGNTVSDALRHAAMMADLGIAVQKEMNEGRHVEILNGAIDKAIERNKGEHPKTH